MVATSLNEKYAMDYSQGWKESVLTGFSANLLEADQTIGYCVNAIQDYAYSGFQCRGGGKHGDIFWPEEAYAIKKVMTSFANALFKGGKTEGWGRGILDILTLRKEAGLPEPEYDFVPNFVCLTIRFKEPITPRLSGDRHNDRPNDSRIDRLNKSVKATFLVIERNPGLQRKRIAELVGKSIPTIDRHLD